jgi:hypothetical protein
VIRIDGQLEPPGARAVGDLAQYHLPLYIREERVRVRANSQWSVGDPRNVIGTLEGHRWVLGTNRLKSWAGIGHAVVLEDPVGDRCRGYISGTVVDVHR